jgi:hypothetical protein
MNKKAENSLLEARENKNRAPRLIETPGRFVNRRLDKVRNPVEFQAGFASVP